MQYLQTVPMDFYILIYLHTGPLIFLIFLFHISHLKNHIFIEMKVKKNDYSKIPSVKKYFLFITTLILLSATNKNNQIIWGHNLDCHFDITSYCGLVIFPPFLFCRLHFQTRERKWRKRPMQQICGYLMIHPCMIAICVAYALDERNIFIFFSYIVYSSRRKSDRNPKAGLITAPPFDIFNINPP